LEEEMTNALITEEHIRKAAEILVNADVGWAEAKKLMMRAVINRALDETNGNMSKAARLLKVHRNTMIRVAYGK
jgi:ActR/RegA family two-component response regulator